MNTYAKVCINVRDLRAVYVVIAGYKEHAFIVLRIGDNARSVDNRLEELLPDSTIFTTFRSIGDIAGKYDKVDLS